MLSLWPNKQTIVPRYSRPYIVDENKMWNGEVRLAGSFRVWNEKCWNWRKKMSIVDQFYKAHCLTPRIPNSCSSPALLLLLVRHKKRHMAISREPSVDPLVSKRPEHKFWIRKLRKKVENGKKWSIIVKMVKSGPKLSKMVLIGPKWS